MKVRCNINKKSLMLYFVAILFMASKLTFSEPVESDGNFCDFLRDTSKKIENPEDIIAIFDWDGTLYNEKIPVDISNINESGKKIKKGRSAQSAWHIWGASHDKTAFPLLRILGDKDGSEIINLDNYLESDLMGTSLSAYEKFSKITLFEAGMTPSGLQESINSYLSVEEYNPCSNMIEESMKLFQQLISRGIKVWIISGSNPYFISTILKYIQEKGCKSEFNFGEELSGPYVQGKSRIYGNSAKLTDSGSFSVIYNDTIFPIKITKKIQCETQSDPDKNKFVATECGKKVLTEAIVLDEKKVEDINTIEANSDCLVVGNSDGDYEMANYCLMASFRHKCVGGVNVKKGTNLDNLLSTKQENTFRINWAPTSSSPLRGQGKD